mgnify:CR=1 FL=1
MLFPVVLEEATQRSAYFATTGRSGSQCGYTVSLKILEVSEEDADEVARRVSSSMESAAELNVPLVVHVGRGSNWDLAH